MRIGLVLTNYQVQKYLIRKNILIYGCKKLNKKIKILKVKILKIFTKTLIF